MMGLRRERGSRSGDALRGVHEQATFLPAIQSGQVPLAVINDKVRRILRKAIQLVLRS